MNDVQKQSESIFEVAKKHNGKMPEYWSARDLMVLLEYASWNKFLDVISRARNSLKKNGIDLADNIVKIKKPVEVGSNAVRLIDDYKLSRYACYLIAMNGDPKKIQVAAAQNYFAVQTRKQEIRELSKKDIERVEAREQYTMSDKYLSSVVINHQTSSKELGAIKSNGDRVLFGGNDTKSMRQKYKIKDYETIADYAPTPVLTAKKLANDMTSYKVKRDDINGFYRINKEHSDNNSAVRQALVQQGLKPENLPSEENVKKVKKRLEKQSEQGLLE